MTYSDPVQQEYARLAPRYDSRWSFYVNATVQQTLNRLNLQPGEHILDLGCGTGTLIQRLLPFSPAIVTGIDPCPEMLAIARRKLPTSVDLQVASADCLPLPDAAFDIVVSTSAFHYFPDPDRALREIRRVLKPAGRTVITDWCHDYFACQICDVLLQRFNHAHKQAYREAECEAMLQAAGLQDIVIERYNINWLWGMMTAQATKPLRSP
ncbi:MAG: methyltransferase domain-containing protein [Elainellaceae cyanobacterium]